MCRGATIGTVAGPARSHPRSGSLPHGTITHWARTHRVPGFFFGVRRSRPGIRLREQAWMRLNMHVRITAAMPGVVYLLARHQIGRCRLAGGGSGIGTSRYAARVQRDGQGCDQGEANGGTRQFPVRNEGLNDAARDRCGCRDRHECRRRIGQRRASCSASRSSHP